MLGRLQTTYKISDYVTAEQIAALAGGKDRLTQVRITYNDLIKWNGDIDDLVALRKLLLAQ